MNSRGRGGARGRVELAPSPAVRPRPEFSLSLRRNFNPPPPPPPLAGSSSSNLSRRDEALTGSHMKTPLVATSLRSRGSNLSTRKSSPVIELRRSVPLTTTTSPPASTIITHNGMPRGPSPQLARQLSSSSPECPHQSVSSSPSNSQKQQQAESKLNPDAPVFEWSPTTVSLNHQPPVESMANGVNYQLNPNVDYCQPNGLWMYSSPDVQHAAQHYPMQFESANGAAGPVHFYQPVQYPLMLSPDGSHMQPVYLMPTPTGPFPSLVMGAPTNMLPAGANHFYPPPAHQQPSSLALPQQFATSVEPVETTNGTVHYYKYWHNGNALFGGQQLLAAAPFPVEPIQQQQQTVPTPQQQPQLSAPKEPEVNQNQQSWNNIADQPAASVPVPVPVQPLRGGGHYRAGNGARGRRFVNSRPPGPMSRYQSAGFAAH